MKPTVRTYLSLGSNVEPEHNLRSAILALRERFGGVDVSCVYRFPAVGFDGPDFLNAAAAIDCDIDPFALNRWLHEGDVASQFAVALEPGSEPRFLEATKALPRVAGAFSKATLLRNMEDVSARNVRIMSTILTLFASVIAVGVVYNNARIALAERTWELASLRVLGFTRGEVSALLLGELAIGIVLALPLGMVMGWGLVHLLVELLKNDQFLFPVVISARTYAVAGLCVVAAGLASALVVRRQIDRLDMVGALKTRE